MRCTVVGTRCKVIHTRRSGRPGAGHTYRVAGADLGHRLRVVVRATNAYGSASSVSRATPVVTPRGGSGPGAAPPSSPPGTDPDPSLFSLVPSSTAGTPPAGIPRSDAECAAAVSVTGEKRPSNAAANNSVPADPRAIPWNPAWSWWPAFVADRDHVTGDFRGTTDEILQWAACKWGLDVNVARAEAWLESGWYMSTRSGCPGPEASFGLFQIVAEDCAGDMVHGGWPYVQDDSALNADYWGSWIRGCFDGAFLVSNHAWQDSPAQGYNDHTMAQVIAQNGEQYALWGCVGAWFSNAWYTSAAQGYIATVQKDERAKLWLVPGT
jgi:hypothetical protein